MRKEKLLKEAKSEIMEKKRHRRKRVIRGIIFLAYILSVPYLFNSTEFKYTEKVLLVIFAAFALIIIDSLTKVIVNIFYEPKVSDEEVFNLYKKRMKKK